jgi:type IV pilus assembly protein PilM
MANFLSDLLSKLSNLFGKQNSSVLGIDIGTSSIKVVQLGLKSGHPVLETYGEISLGPYVGKNPGEAVKLSLDKIVEAVSDLLREKEVNITTKLCGIAIPFASSLMSVIQLPVMPQKQLDLAIPIEARKYIPVPILDVALDWYVIPEDKNPDKDETVARSMPQKQEVLIVAIHNETISRYKEIITKTGLNARFFEIEIFSTMRSILDQEVEPVLIVDMGALTTKLYIVEKGILRSSHMIGQGSQSITDEFSKSLGISLTEAEIFKREKGLLGEINGINIQRHLTITLGRIFSEANRVVLSYQQKYNKNVSKAVLVGGGSSLKGIVDVAKQNFQIEVVTGDSFQKVIAPAFLEKVLKDTAPEFAVAVGVALRRLQEQ